MEYKHETEDYNRILNCIQCFHVYKNFTKITVTLSELPKLIASEHNSSQISFGLLFSTSNPLKYDMII